MPGRAVALLSGGLDSMLAIRVLQEQGFEVEALNFQTIFTCCNDHAGRAARELGVRLTVIGQDDEYLELIRKPEYGYGKGANPCVDCRIYMFRLAKHFLEEVGGQMVISGEVLGQRPNSQKRRQLAIIAQQSGLDGRLLRPLSAQLLPPTLAEREGRVDRTRLFSFSGRSRKPLIRLAQHFGFEYIPSPSTGCSLTEKTFAVKVHDLVQLDSQSGRWDFELLNVGRHLRLDGETKAVVGRREQENAVLQAMYRAPDSRASILLVPEGFSGPTVMVIGPPSDETLEVARGLVARYAKHCDESEATVRADVAGEQRLLEVQRHKQAEALATL